MTGTAFDGLLAEYFLEARERIDRLEAVLLDLPERPEPERRELLDDARRELHTLKGNAGMMGLKETQALAHTLEDAVDALDPGDPDVASVLVGLDELRKLLQVGAPGENRWLIGAPRGPGDGGEREEREAGSVRVPFAALDSLVDLLAEMVIFRNRLADSVARGRCSDRQPEAWEEVGNAQEALGKTLGFIQDRAMRLRMVPLQSLFVQLRRIVHDEGAREGKAVRFRVVGGDTPMDKALLEVAGEALGHFVRNAVVHGVESEEARRSAGKDPVATVRLSAAAHAEEVWIDVADDGGGIRRESLSAAAAERGIELTSDDDPYDLLFLPGFSTRRGADMSAGRGMGLSAAVEAVRRIGGSVEVASEPGAWSRFRLRLPLTVSISSAMLLRVDGEEYALPLTSIVESLRFEPGDGHTLNHAGVLTWRDRVIPLLDLGHVFGTRVGVRHRGYVVLMESEGKRRGLVVEDLAGIREIVVKKLDPIMGHPPGIGASTILGDGRVILILDPKGLASYEPFIHGTTGGGVPAARSGERA